MVPDLRWFDLKFFYFTRVRESDMHSVEAIVQILKFRSSPGLTTCSVILSCESGGLQEWQLPVSHAIAMVNSQYNYNQSVFHFQCSILSTFKLG